MSLKIFKSEKYIHYLYFIINIYSLFFQNKRKHLLISDKNDIIYSDRYAEEGVEMILENNLMGALEYITVAIEYNPSDYRHYINRCYCYLRINQPA